MPYLCKLLTTRPRKSVPEVWDLSVTWFGMIFPVMPLQLTFGSEARYIKLACQVRTFVPLDMESLVLSSLVCRYESIQGSRTATVATDKC